MKRAFASLLIILLTLPILGQKSIGTISVYDINSIKPLQGAYNAIPLKNMPQVKSISLPDHLLSSIYRKGSIERTINVYGQSLIVESAESYPNGDVQLVLRREDGRDFYNLYPLVKAELRRQDSTMVQKNTGYEIEF